MIGFSCLLMQVEAEQTTKELKHLRFLKEIAVKFLVLLSNVYNLAKETSGVRKTTLGSAEIALLTVVRPVYKKLKDFSEQILVFVDDKVHTHIHTHIKF